MSNTDFEREEARRRRRMEREARRAERKRAWDEGESTWGGRKGRVLHTRIPERLAEDIRKVAEELRVPVSNVVRNVLEDVFSVVEAVTDNVGDIVEDVLGEANRARERLARQPRRRRHRAGEFEREEEGGTADEPTPDEAPPAPRIDLPDFPDVMGWQPILLNKARTCAGCSRELERGTRVYIGVKESGLSSAHLCLRCARGVVTPG